MLDLQVNTKTKSPNLIKQIRKLSHLVEDQSELPDIIDDIKKKLNKIKKNNNNSEQ